MTKERLKDWERDAVLFIERYHAVAGKTPEDSDVVDYLTYNKHEVTLQQFEELKNDTLFQKSMEARGIVLTLNSDLNSLTPKQMAAAAVMTNLIDRRSDEKKLRDLGITTTEWATWMQNDTFARYLAGRAEKLIANSQHEAHVGLLRAVRTGNVPAIKYLNEMTGRYNPEQDSQVNVRILIGRVMEIIQKHIKDPNVLNSMGAELMQVAVEQSAVQSQPRVIKQPLEL